MSPSITRSPSTLDRRTAPLVQCAALVIVLSGIHLIAPVLVPVLMAVVIAAAASGLANFGDQRLPRPLSAALALVVTLTVVVSLGTAVSMATADLLVSIPDYEDEWRKLRSSTALALSKYKFYGLAASVQRLELGPQLSQWIPAALEQLLETFSFAFVVALLSGFLMLESSVFPEKVLRLQRLTGLDIAATLSGRLRLQRYLGIKTTTSTATGVAAAALCWFLEVPHAGLFGLIAFGLNYIPTVGSIIAAIPAIGFAVLANGWETGLAVAGGYLALNVLIGNILEPQWMSSSYRMSPVAILISMLFWGFVLGPVGALLSVPLTAVIRAATGASERYRWLAVLLESPSQTRRESQYDGLVPAKNSPSVAETTAPGTASLQACSPN